MPVHTSSQYLMYNALRRRTYSLPAVSMTILTFFSPYLKSISLLVFNNRAVRWIQWSWRDLSCTAWAITLTLRRRRAAPTLGSPTALPAPSAILWECRAEPPPPWEECSIHSSRFAEDFSVLLWLPSCPSLFPSDAGGIHRVQENNFGNKYFLCRRRVKDCFKSKYIMLTAWMCSEIPCSQKKVYLVAGTFLEREAYQTPSVFLFFPVDVI